MPDVNMKQGDLLPVVAASLRNPDGSAVNLTAASVRFIMRAPDSTSPKVSAAATVTSVSTGGVRYNWVTADTNAAGDYLAEFEVTFAGALVQTFPNDGYLTVAVLRGLG